MGSRRKLLLFLLVCCTFASFVSAQSISVTFLDEWGEQTSRVLEEGKAWLRVIDPAADTSPGPDAVAVELASTLYLDSSFTVLPETGDSTGVFEGEVSLTTDFYANYLDDVNHLLTSPRTYPPVSLDSVNASYNGVTGSAEAAPSLTHFLDDGGASPAVFALGGPVRVRVRDRFADTSSGQDTTTATLTASGGDTETLVLTETGVRSAVFETSLPLSAGAPAPQDGRLQAAAGETLTVSHADDNGFSSSLDTAGVTATSVRFIDRREGRPAERYVEVSEVVVRVTDPGANADAGDFDSVTVTLSRTVDAESLTLLETGPDTGVFEGRMRLGKYYYGQGNGLLEPSSPTAPNAGQVTVVYGTLSDSAGVVPSVTRLLNAAGEEASTVALGETLRVQVEAADGLSSGGPDRVRAQVRSLTTGDEEDLFLLETDGMSWLFEGTFEPTVGSAAPGDGLLQAQPGETLVAEHFDILDVPSSSAEAGVVRSAVRFVDEGGRPVSILLESGIARLEILDLLSAGQQPPAATISSRLGQDFEELDLAEAAGASGLFSGSIPLFVGYGSVGNGALETAWGLNPVNHHDTVTAESNGASARATTAPGLLDFVDAQGEPIEAAAAGASLGVRLVSHRANASADPDSVYAIVRSQKAGDMEYLSLTETGPDTSVFEATFPTRRTNTSAYPDGTLTLQPRDTVKISYDPPNPYYSTDADQVVDSLEIVPVAVELVNAQGSGVSTYVFAETVHLRVSEADANADPGTAESVSVLVQAWRRTDNRPDQETVLLSETGADTGVFEGSLPTQVVPYSAWPFWNDGLLQFPNVVPPQGDYATVTATRGEASDRAEVRDSVLRFTDAAGNDVEQVPVGSPLHVRLLRPLSSTTSGADTETVEVWTHTGYSVDLEPVVLTETGGATGLFVGAIPTAPAPFTSGNGLLEGSVGTVVEVIKDANGMRRSYDLATLAEPANQAPEAVDDTAGTLEDTPVVIDVLANDSDPEGWTLWITTLGTVAHGTVTVNLDGTFTYTPDPGFHGTETFTYEIRDNFFAPYRTAMATVTVTVAPVNDAPVAVNDSATFNENTAAVIPVLGNDSDPEGDAVSVVSVTQGTRGTAAINADGTITYTPQANVHGSDSFTYTVADGGGATATATVAITILSVNVAPNAADDHVTTDEDTPLTIDVRTNDIDGDGDALAVTNVSSPNRGSAVVNANGTVTYTPAANLHGSDSFSYTMTDGNGGSDTADVSITVSPVNDSPVAAADAGATAEDTPVTLSVLANDSDPDGDALTVTAVTQSAIGSVATNGTTLTFSPAANASGTATFTYTVSDGNGATATASVTVSVAAVNDAPSVAADSGATRENVSVILAVLANDTDVEGNPLAVTATSTPANGITSHLADNTVSYTPHPNFTGTETFTYTASDGQGGTTTGQVTVVVGEALERVAVLATNSVALRAGSDVLSGDVIVNQAGTGPFLNAAELSVGGSVTTAANFDVEGDSVTVAAGAAISGDVRYNQLTNNGTIGGPQTSPLPLPVFSSLPPFLAAAPGATNINVANNGTRTLAAGSYQDLVVGRKGIVTLTGGTYHFRSILVDREAKLYFSAASQIRVQQKLSTRNLTVVGPGPGAAIDASSIVFYVGGVNGTGGGLAATPKTVEIGVDNTVSANLYAPNGTIWLQDRTQATGAFVGRDLDVAVDVQVALDSAFSGGQ